MKVVTLQASNFRDPVATLRVIADEIEAGKHGVIGIVAIALRGDTDLEDVSVFGTGPESEPAAMAILFYRAFQKIAGMF